MRQRDGHGVVAFLLGVAALNATLTFENVWPSLWVRPAAALSVEILVLLLVAVLAVELRGRVSGAVLWIAACLLFVLSLGRYIEITTRALLGRPINLYFDLEHVPRVLEMTVGARPVTDFLLFGALALAVAVAMPVALRLAMGALARGLLTPALRRITAALAFLGVASFAVGQATGIGPLQRGFADPVLPVFARQAVAVAAAATQDGSADRFAAGAPPSSDLAALTGADVFVIFFESYGAVAYRDPAIAATVAPRVRALEQRLRTTGWQAVSAYFTAPTFGGASWLSHASFLAGMTIANNRDYHRLLQSGRPTLLDTVRRAGYRTVALMPGLKRAWPEGRYYRYDTVYDAEALGYGGPKFGWWAIPDQYSLEFLLRQAVVPRQRQPLFVLFPTVMSHVPFAPLPPYVPDWSRLEGGTAFAGTRNAEDGGAIGDWSQLKTAYRASIRYEFDVLGGFLEQPAARGALIIVLGDHQPPAMVSGAQDDWRVPVHVLSQTPNILDRIAEAGFDPGMLPAGKALGPLADLQRIILAAVDADGGRTVRGPRPGSRMAP